jgi:hypothetical protein
MRSQIQTRLGDLLRNLSLKKFSFTYFVEQNLSIGSPEQGLTPLPFSEILVSWLRLPLRRFRQRVSDTKT